MRLKRHAEALGFRFVEWMFSTLSLEKASALGGFLSRWACPLLPLHQVGKRNLSTVFPHLSSWEKKAILHEMWEEWGRIIAEYCHLDRFVQEPSFYTLYGQEIITSLRDDDKPALLFTAHLSHFQLISIAAQHCGLPLAQFYRPANNAYVNERMFALQKKVTHHVIPKGKAGLRILIDTLKAGQHVLMLVDQRAKYGGVSLPFLGHPALTATSVASLSHRFQCPLVPVRVKRMAPLHFEVTFYPPISHRASPEATMADVNEVMSQWIKEQPGQWLWVHERWTWSR